MGSGLNQRKAKVMIRDYLRETGRKGVTSLMKDIGRHTRTVIFTQRTLEKWLAEQSRQLNDDNWQVLLSFLQSDQFKSQVPYENEGAPSQRLISVGDGLTALYGAQKRMDGVVMVSSSRPLDAIEATQLLTGEWEGVTAHGDESSMLRSLCKIEPVDGKRYAKFAYMGMFRMRQLTTTGLIIYLNTEQRDRYDYCHLFYLQLWRRRDPETASTMPAELTFLTEGKKQPELKTSNVINQYFYKAEETHLDQALIMRRQGDIFPEEAAIMDLLLEDVLPHGYA